MADQIYLDYNATAPMRPDARHAVIEAMAVAGNPSSVHTSGRAARRVLEDARRDVARLCGTVPANVVFTGGATESNNLALKGFGPDVKVITSAAEHPSVLEAVEGSRVPVGRAGLIDLGALEDILAAGGEGRQLLSIILVNNETGVIQPLAEINDLAKKHGALIHVDAVQAAGKLPLSFDDMQIDLMSISAHKFGGPKGVGALIVNPRNHLMAEIKGGGQEKGRRAGTENVAGAAGFGAACRAVTEDAGELDRISVLRDRLETRLTERLPDLVIAGAEAPRAGHVTCIASPGIGAEKQVMAMDLAGIAVSAGSACSSGKVRQSHVLSAMGYPPEVAGSAIRVSLGWATEVSDIDAFFEAYCAFIEKQRINN
ncbi:cysteine desulfurase family protein [Aestuariispira insulae]|uniref:Cysteine desulfurase n=1 Tax=Aestuariispira insulae TaxID=1461337 RepID=A0A3D9HVV3_9PROT|nr:cysteine desulfurase family protein [Aestuariispira insulae]RED53644.1 cysteine desulfurase [Aestuariispira insulae]